jgi:hypothetical protein
MSRLVVVLLPRFLAQAVVSGCAAAGGYGGYDGDGESEWLNSATTSRLELFPPPALAR